MVLKGMTRYLRNDGNTVIGSTEDVEYYTEDGCYIVLEHNPNVRGNQLAQYMDSELENANYHEFAGMYEKLYAIFVTKAGVVVADDILDAIAESNYIP